jgi:transposase-like protein
MVAEVASEYGSRSAAIRAVAQKLIIGSAETVRKWVRQAEFDTGQWPGTTSEESTELKRLRRARLGDPPARTPFDDKVTCRGASTAALINMSRRLA